MYKRKTPPFSKKPTYIPDPKGRTMWNRHADALKGLNKIDRARRVFKTKALMSGKSKLLDRNNKIVEMRVDKKMKLDEIAKEVGVTRERVRQILLVEEKKRGTIFPKHVGFRATDALAMVAVHCKICGNIREIQKRNYNPDKIYFCLKHKYIRGKSYSYWLKNPKYFEMSYLEQQRWIYHNTEKKDEARISSAKWVENLKKNPVKYRAYREHQAKYSRAWSARKREASKPKPRDFIE